jgi:hypothetical protein
MSNVGSIEGGSLGDEWYGGFWLGIQSFAARHRKQWVETTTDKKWSRFIFEALSEQARDQSFNEKPEEMAFHSRRFDRAWRRRGDTTVLIEHENWGVKYVLGDEVIKLARQRADLHVCITYVPARRFPGNEDADKCMRVLSEERFDGEFLLVLGTDEMWSPTDWVCHRFSPQTTLRADTIVLPSRPNRRRTHSKSRTAASRDESGWERLKRTYPTSADVSIALRGAGKRKFSTQYVRVLERLRQFWLKRGK